MPVKNTAFLKLSPKSPSLKQNTAAHYLVTKIPLARSTETLSQIRKRIFDEPEAYDTLNYIHVVSDNLVLKGILTIHELFKGSPTTKVSKVMTKKLVTARPDADPHVASHLAIKNSLKSIPLTDKNGVLVGILPADAVQKILHTETQKDLLRLGGISDSRLFSAPTLEIPVLQSFISRSPWILVGLFGGFFAGGVIDYFTHTLQDNLLLAAFIPLVAYLANAVGTQTQTLLIRDLNIDPKLPVIKYFLRQFLVAILIGLSAWAVIYFLITLVWGAPLTGHAVGLAVFAAITVANFFAVFIPVTLLRLQQDPAIGSGPFATIIQDLLSIVIYFYIASILLT